MMGWIDTVDRAVGGLMAAGRWLVLPLALSLFLQWPLRDFVSLFARRQRSRPVDLCALRRLAVTLATRDAPISQSTPWRTAIRRALARRDRPLGQLLCVAPWAFFMVWTLSAHRAALGAGSRRNSPKPTIRLLPDQIAALLLAVLALVQALSTSCGREGLTVETGGLWMLLAVAVVLLATGLPACAVLMGVSVLCGVSASLAASASAC